MPYKLIRNQLGGSDICQILILIAVVVVVYYFFVQSQPAVNSSNQKKVEKYSSHSDIGVSSQAFTSDEEKNRKTRPAVDVNYTGVPYYHIPSVLTSENSFATPEQARKNEVISSAKVAKMYERERKADMKDAVLGRKKMDHDFGIVVENPRVYRKFQNSPVTYSPPFDTTTVQSTLSDSPISSTSARSRSYSTPKSDSSSVSASSSSVAASSTLSPPDFISTAPSTGMSPGPGLVDRNSLMGKVTSTPVISVVSSPFEIPKTITPTQPSSIISSVIPSTSEASSTPATPSSATPATPVRPVKPVKSQVVEKFTDVNKLYSAEDGYDLKTPLSKSLCSQKCCGYYWKENMGDLFKKKDTVGWADIGVGKKYRTSNVTCMGDGVAPPGCRCYTGEQQDLLSTRGGNGSKYY
jgi:hypothetical protein